MALRSLSTEITFRDNATKALQGVDSEIDGIKDNIMGTQEGFEELGYETGETAYSMQGSLQDVGDATEDLGFTTSEVSYSMQDSLGDVGGATDELSHKTGGFRDTMGRVGGAVQRNWNMIAGAIGAAGVALEGIIRKNQELELQTDQVAIAMGGQTEEVREMISGVTDYTFSTEDALAGAARLIKSGYDQEDQMKTLLPLFDKLSDATGIGVVEAIDLVDRAFSAMDKDLLEVSDHLDTFTWLQTQTTVGMQEFGMLMRRESDAIKDTGLTIEDMAVAMATLEAEGVRGPRMVMAMQDAFREADGDAESFWKNLNVTNESLEVQWGRLEAAEGLTDRLADAYADNFTLMQKWHSSLMETNYAYSGLISNLDFLVPLLTGTAVAMGMLAAAKFLLVGVTIAGALAFTILAAKVLLIAGIIVAVGVGIYYLWKHWDQVIDWLGAKVDMAVEWIGSAWDKLGVWMGETWNSIVSWAKDTIGALMEVDIPYWIGYALGAVITWVADIKVSAMEAGLAILEGVLEFVVTLPGRLWDYLVEGTTQLIEWAPQAYSRALDAGRQLVDGAMSIITDLPSLVWDTLLAVGRKLLDIPGQWYDNARSAASSLWEGFKSGLGMSSPSYLEQAMDNIMIKAHDMKEYLSNEFDYLSRLDNTEIGYHGVVEEPDERGGFFHKAGKMFSPERELTPTAAGGMSIGIGDIHVYSQSDNPREVAQEVKRTLRREFSTEADRYFGKQRRKR